MKSEYENNKIIINKSDLTKLNQLINCFRVPLIRDHKKIESLINMRIKGNILDEQYKKEYKEIVTDCKKKLMIFKNKFIELYIINEIYKKLKDTSIILYSNVSFDDVLSGIEHGLKINILPINIFDDIINFNSSKLIKTIAHFKFDLVVSSENDISKKEITNIKAINDKIKNQRKIREKCMIKEKKI